MKWRYFSLADNDPKAKKQVLKNLEMGAYEHTLTKKLLSHFSEASGPMLLIAFDSLDLTSDYLYAYGTYSGGKGWLEALGNQDLSQMDSPMGGLIRLVENILGTSKDALLLCESWAATRKSLAGRPADLPPRESRVLFYKEEVYHVLTGRDANADTIECTIRESNSPWVTGVCSLCAEVPRAEIPSEAFFDGIVANTAYIFSSALDGEGYLVWSPASGIPGAEGKVAATKSGEDGGCW